MNKGIVIDDWNPLSSVIVEFEKVQTYPVLTNKIA